MPDLNDYEEKPGTGLALTGMILGIVSIFLCLGPLSGIPAVIVSGISLSKAGKGKSGGQGMALTGLITGIIGICLVSVWLILAAMLIPAFSKAKDSAKRISCMNNEKQIALALLMYAEDNNSQFPPYDGAQGLDLLRQKEYLENPSVFICPNSNHKPAALGEALTEETCDYIYISGLNLESGDDTPILWDKPDNHKKYGNIVYIDGHVQGYKGINWMPDAGIRLSIANPVEDGNSSE